MAFVKKTWKDRLVEFAGRRTITRVSGSADGTMIVDVTRSEGTVSQVGDAFSAENMNDLEQRIGNEFDALNQNLQNILEGASMKNWKIIKQSSVTQGQSVETIFDAPADSFILVISYSAVLAGNKNTPPTIASDENDINVETIAYYVWEYDGGAEQFGIYVINCNKGDAIKTVLTAGISNTTISGICNIICVY